MPPFFTVYTLWGDTLYVLVFIELATRRVHFAGSTARPNDAWVTQQARNLTFSLADRAEPLRFLIHDRDSKFTASFDEVFRGEGVEVIRTPVRAPRANAIAERFVRTVRTECLDWLLITGRRHLDSVLRTYVDHYNRSRPHRGLDLRVPEAMTSPVFGPAAASKIGRRDRLGGLIHEYPRAA